MLKSTCNVIRPTLVVKDQGSKLRFGQAVAGDYFLCMLRAGGWGFFQVGNKRKNRTKRNS